MFLVLEIGRGRGVTVLSRDKTEVSRGRRGRVVNAISLVTDILEKLPSHARMLHFYLRRPAT